jgi:hypothetical protein
MRFTLLPLESFLPLGEASDAGNALLCPKFAASQPCIKKCPTRQSWEERTRQRVGRGLSSSFHHHRECDKKKTEMGQFRGIFAHCAKR